MREMAVNLNVKSLKISLGIIWHGTFMTGREEIHSKAEKDTTFKQQCSQINTQTEYKTFGIF